MTTEVIIKNKSGMVLAADSAVTVTGIGVYGRNEKVYNSANKLFTLSKTEPIGVLIYNAAAINDIPVELIIKEFRSISSSKNSYKKLSQYQDELIKFMETFVKKNAKYQKLINFFDAFLRSFTSILIRERSEQGEAFSFDSFIIKHEDILNTACVDYECPDEFPGITLKDIESEFAFNKNYEQRFNKFKENTQYSKNIDSIAKLFYSFVRYNICQSYTGIAICGYGKDDFFPKVYRFNVYGVINGNLLTGGFVAHEGEEAEIIPLAQRQMIDTFIKGVSDRLYSSLEKLYFDNFDAFIQVITPSLKAGVNPQDLIEKLGEKFIKNSRVFKDVAFEIEEKPLIDSVNHLSREEMAELAESLINIQVLKYKVSPDLETVGGPIDVAIISKHDGFVWKKRKLYFPKDLNFQFFDNYFK